MCKASVDNELMKPESGGTTMWTKPTYQNIRLGFEITMYFKAD